MVQDLQEPLVSFPSLVAWVKLVEALAQVPFQVLAQVLVVVLYHLVLELFKVGVVLVLQLELV